jgi:predicted Zn finger-like uncharacterized protein
MFIMRTRCPECGAAVKMDKPLPVGERVECPRCGTRFALGKADNDAVASAVLPADRFSEPAFDPWQEEEVARRARKRRSRRRPEGVPPGLLLGLALGGMFLLLIAAGVGLFILVRGNNAGPPPGEAAAGHAAPEPVGLGEGPLALRQRLVGVWRGNLPNGTTQTLHFKRNGDLVVTVQARGRSQTWPEMYEVVRVRGNTLRIMRLIKGGRPQVQDITFQDDNHLITTGPGGAVFERQP